MANSQTSDTSDEITMQITKDLLLKAFTRDTKTTDVFIKDFTTSKISGDGVNFSSVVISVVVNIQIEGKEKTEHLILKLKPEKKFMKEFDYSAYFTKEADFYGGVFPAMIRLQQDRGIQPFGPSVPAHVYISDSSSSVIMLEDLKQRGYRLPDSRLNYEQCKLVMTQLAKFHALGFALKDGDRCNLDKYDAALGENLWSRPFPDVYARNFRLSVRCVKLLTSDERILAAADSFGKNNLEDLVSKLLKPVEPYAMICHGDCWRNNLLFKYDLIDGKETPVDVKLLDFQISYYALPTIDLSYFFYTSMTREMRDEKRQELFGLYHESFVQSLKLLNIDIPEYTLEVLESLYKQTVLYGMVSLYTFFPTAFTRQTGSEKSQEEIESEFPDIVRAMSQKDDYMKQIFVDPLEEMINLGVL